MTSKAAGGTKFRLPPDRDLSIDFARAMCLPVVVLLHAMQMGIGGEPLRAFNALEAYQPLAWGTWVLMIMPVFFICGGFAAITQWRRLHGAGETPAHYIRSWTLRLVRPVVAVMIGVGLVLGAMAFAGVDAEFLRTFAIRLAQPLWFIAVYIGCTALVPVMSWLHRHAAWATYFGLAAGACLVDLLSRGFDVPIAPLNWLFVWLFAQQLGFGVRDGWYAKRPKWVLVVLTLASYVGIAILVFVFGYSHDMIGNLNPPTLCILLLALAQVYLFTLLQPAIRRLMESMLVLRFVAVFGIFGMTIYLWHTVAMAAAVGVQLTFGMLFPAPLSSAWWVTRPLWILAIAVFIAAFCAVIPRIERAWPAPIERVTPLVLSILWSVIAMAGVGVVLTQGYVPWWNGVIGFALVVAAVVALTIGGPGESLASGERVREDARSR